MSFFDDASWVLIPEGIKEDVVYAQKPTDGLGDLTFTRASDATRTNSAGVIERTPWNLFQFSEQFDNAAWTKVNSSVSANTTTAPNGTLTADTLVENTANSTHIALQNPPGQISGNTYTASIYAKAAGRSWIGLYNNAGGTGDAFFDLSNGTVGTVSTGSAQIQSVGNGWYRCSITFVPTVTGNFNIHLRIASADNVPTYTGNGTSGIFIWGAQLVEGTDAKPYFATTNRQDVPRLDYRNADGTLSTFPRLNLEPQRTNSIRNSSMVGAVAGTPGTLPTNWLVSNGGLTQTIVGVGTESGLQYVDIRLNGTATGTIFNLFTEGPAQVVASNGQTWTNSFYMKLVAAPNPYNTILNNFSERTAAGALLTGAQQAMTLTSTLTRFTFTRTNTNALTERINAGYQGTLTIAATYDFTIRIAAPQMELGAYATTWVPTTTAAVTRLADSASKTGVSSIIGQSAGTIFWDVNDLTGTTTGTGNPDFAIRNTAFTNWIGITTNSFALPFRVVVRPTSGSIINYEANITRAKAAVAWSSAGAVLYVNGVQVGTSAVNPNFSFDRIDMLGGIISYKTNQAALFPTRLTNAQLAQLTTL